MNMMREPIDAALPAKPFPPIKSGLRRTIGLELYRRGMQSRSALLRLAQKAADTNRFNVLRAFHNMLQDGQLIESEGLFGIPDAAREDYANLDAEQSHKAAKAKAESGLVPSRVPVPFKPLSARYMPPLGGPRDCAVREFHPVSMSSRVRTPFDGDGEV